MVWKKRLLDFGAVIVLVVLTGLPIVLAFALFCWDDSSCGRFERYIVNDTYVTNWHVAVYSNGCAAACAGNSSYPCVLPDPGYFTGGCEPQGKDRLMATFSILMATGSGFFLVFGSVLVFLWRKRELERHQSGYAEIEEDREYP